jgi:hypothetical protein
MCGKTAIGALWAKAVEAVLCVMLALAACGVVLACDVPPACARPWLDAIARGESAAFQVALSETASVRISSAVGAREGTEASGDPLIVQDVSTTLSGILRMRACATRGADGAIVEAQWTGVRCMCTLNGIAMVKVSQSVPAQLLTPVRLGIGPTGLVEEISYPEIVKRSARLLWSRVLAELQVGGDSTLQYSEATPDGVRSVALRVAIEGGSGAWQLTKSTRGCARGIIDSGNTGDVRQALLTDECVFAFQKGERIPYRISGRGAVQISYGQVPVGRKKYDLNAVRLPWIPSHDHTVGCVEADRTAQVVAGLYDPMPARETLHLRTRERYLRAPRDSLWAVLAAFDSTSAAGSEAVELSRAFAALAYRDSAEREAMAVRLADPNVSYDTATCLALALGLCASEQCQLALVRALEVQERHEPSLGRVILGGLRRCDGLTQEVQSRLRAARATLGEDLQADVEQLCRPTGQSGAH